MFLFFASSMIGIELWLISRRLVPWSGVGFDLSYFYFRLHSIGPKSPRETGTTLAHLPRKLPFLRGVSRTPWRSLFYYHPGAIIKSQRVFMARYGARPPPASPPLLQRGRGDNCTRSSPGVKIDG